MGNGGWDFCPGMNIQKMGEKRKEEGGVESETFGGVMWPVSLAYFWINFLEEKLGCSLLSLVSQC